jgi:Protein of unknown function (DUF3034)
VLFACLAWAATTPVLAGDRLAWSGAVSQIEGNAGGGLVPWALIGGLGTDVQLGASAFVTYVSTQDFELRTTGASLDLGDRLELSVARQRFDAGSVLPGLELGQDIVAGKLRVAGDAIFAPDSLMPQISLGAEWKHTLDFDAIPRTLGAAAGTDVDFYVAATKLVFAALAGRNLIVDATLRRTRANQFGLLGFGGNGHGYDWRPELSAALFLTDEVLLGVEYRGKPDNLTAFTENSAEDLFLAWGPLRNLTLIAAAANLGRIAGKPAQRGIYLSVWYGY